MYMYVYYVNKYIYIYVLDIYIYICILYIYILYMYIYIYVLYIYITFCIYVIYIYMYIYIHICMCIRYRHCNTHLYTSGFTWVGLTYSRHILTASEASKILRGCIRMELQFVGSYALVNKHSYGKWPLIVDFLIKNGDFP